MAKMKRSSIQGGLQMKKFIKNWGSFILQIVFYAISMFFCMVPILTDSLPEASQLTDNEAICITWAFFLGLLYASSFYSIKHFVVDLIEVKRKKRNAVQDEEVSHD